MRLAMTSIALMSLLLLPAKGLAQQAETQNSQHQGGATSSRFGVQTRIRLKSGKKISGELFREMPDRIQIYRNGDIEIIPRSEIKEVEFGKSFWQKMKTGLGWVAIAPLYAVALAYLFIRCGGPKDCLGS